MRLGVYADVVYERDETGVSCSLSFVTWLAALREFCEEVVILGRLNPSPGRQPYALPTEITFVALPYYRSLRQPGTVARATPATVRRFYDVVGDLDVVLLFGPHPLSTVFACVARIAGKPVVAGVRQDFVPYAVRRSRGPAGLSRSLAETLEFTHRRAARWGGAVVVEPGLAPRYAGRHTPVLVTGISLVPVADVVPDAVAAVRPWPGEHLALTVTRLDAEKNPLLLADALVELRRRGPWRLVVAGDGPLRGELEERAAALGVGDAIEVRGQVDRAGLRTLYGAATVFIHVSWTEGRPQVLYEAAAAGLPIIATGVGGVRAALGDGMMGELVPPGDGAAIGRALDRLSLEPLLRKSRVIAALSMAREDTMESQAARLTTFLERVVADHAGPDAEPVPSPASENNRVKRVVHRWSARVRRR
jgi:glycosyltransferase involved in cell wall biosynthesis